MNDSKMGRVTQPCAECGNDFECPLFLGKAVTAFCSQCQGARDRKLQLEEAERHQRTLESQRREWIESATGIPLLYRGLTWDDFKYDLGGANNRKRVQAFRQWVSNFPVDQTPLGVTSLLIASQMNGVGKTMLACLILQDLLNRYEQVDRKKAPFQFWTVDDVRLRIESARRFGGKETPEDVYRDFGTMRLLILDDVGKEKMVGYDAAEAYQMYFTILNKRYNNRLPVVLTSNLTYQPWEPEGFCLTDLMGRVGASRLLEMTGGVVYIVEGEDRR
jgi:DNA replication protein DnaC